MYGKYVVGFTSVLDSTGDAYIAVGSDCTLDCAENVHVAVGKV